MKTHRVRFPSFTEVLRVAKDLGYRKVEAWFWEINFVESLTIVFKHWEHILDADKVHALNLLARARGAWPAKPTKKNSVLLTKINALRELALNAGVTWPCNE